MYFSNCGKNSSKSCACFVLLGHGTWFVGQNHYTRTSYQVSYEGTFSALALNLFDPALTSTPVTQQVAVDILDVGVNGGPAGDTAGGHIGVRLRVDILEALPGNTGAELWKPKLKC